MCSTWPSGKALAWCVEGSEFDSGHNFFPFASFLFFFFFFFFSFSFHFRYNSFVMFLYTVFIYILVWISQCPNTVNVPKVSKMGRFSPNAAARGPNFRLRSTRLCVCRRGYTWRHPAGLHSLRRFSWFGMRGPWAWDFCFISTDCCAQVPAVSTHLSERCLDDIWPGRRASPNDFLRHPPSFLLI